MLIENPSHVNYSNKSRSDVVKKFINSFQDVKKQQFKEFLATMMNFFKTMESIQYENFATEMPKVQFNELIRDAIGRQYLFTS